MAELPATPVVGIATVDSDEIEEGSIWVLLKSCDPRKVQLVLVCRDVQDDVRDRVASSPAVLETVTIGHVGLSQARNAGLRRLSEMAPPDGLIVCFPDDDCSFEESTIDAALAHLVEYELVLGTYGEAPRPVDDRPRPLTMREVFHEGNSVGIFARWNVVRAIDGFDERLGVGSGDVEAAEDIEFLARAVAKGYRGIFDPSIMVRHPRRSDAILVRAGAYVAVAVRHLRHRQAIVRLVKPVLGSLLGRSPIPRSALRHLLRPRTRKGLSMSSALPEQN